MATCKDCIHYFACSAKGGLFNEKDETKEMLCRHFKNKADFVEVVRCKDCPKRYTNQCRARHERADMDFCSSGIR